MVIDDLDIQGVAVLKAEADTPSIIDPHAPLTFAVATQGFQFVAGRDPEIFEGVSIVEHLQLSLGDTGKCFEPARASALEQCLCVLAAEGLDHGVFI